MVSKRDRDAESGLKLLSLITIIWSIGFFYWSRDGTLLGYDTGFWMKACCSSINLILVVVFLATWLYVRKENRVKAHLEEHFRTNSTLATDDVAAKFGMKKSRASRTVILWLTESKIHADYDSTTGIFKLKQIEPVSEAKELDEL